MIALGIGPFQESMTLWPNIQIYSKMGRFVLKWKRLESQWMVEQDLRIRNNCPCSQPEEASEKSTEESLARAEKTFERLQEIRKEAEQKVADEHGKKCPAGSR